MLKAIHCQLSSICMCVSRFSQLCLLDTSMFVPSTIRLSWKCLQELKRKKEHSVLSFKLKGEKEKKNNGVQEMQWDEEKCPFLFLNFRRQGKLEEKLNEEILVTNLQHNCFCGESFSKVVFLVFLFKYVMILKERLDITFLSDFFCSLITFNLCNLSFLFFSLAKNSYGLQFCAVIVVNIIDSEKSLEWGSDYWL